VRLDRKVYIYIDNDIGNIMISVVLKNIGLFLVT